MRGEFLTLADAKVASSGGSVIRVSKLPDKGLEPLAFRNPAQPLAGGG